LLKKYPHALHSDMPFAFFGPRLVAAGKSTQGL